jgi:hypothetical protein
MPLKLDGLDERWDAGVLSDWEGDLGRNDPVECRRYAPFAIQRLNDPQLEGFRSRQHELEVAQIGPPEADSIGDIPDDITRVRQTEGGATYVNSLSYRDFRDRLVIHFDIKHRQRKIQWPTRKAPAAAANIVSMQDNIN